VPSDSFNPLVFAAKDFKLEGDEISFVDKDTREITHAADKVLWYS
jgi:hypothetical protein